MIERLIIIPCGRRKIWGVSPDAGPTRAALAYTGAPFKMNRRYAESFSSRWMILSAHYGLIEPDFMIPAPYDTTFNRSSSHPIAVERVTEQVGEQGLFLFGAVEGLGGKHYRRVLTEAFRPYGIRVEFPFAGLTVGRAMRAIKQALALAA